MNGNGHIICAALSPACPPHSLGKRWKRSPIRSVARKSDRVGTSRKAIALLFGVWKHPGNLSRMLAICFALLASRSRLGRLGYWGHWSGQESGVRSQGRSLSTSLPRELALGGVSCQWSGSGYGDLFCDLRSRSKPKPVRRR